MVIQTEIERMEKIINSCFWSDVIMIFIKTINWENPRIYDDENFKNLAYESMILWVFHKSKKSWD